MAVRGIDVSEAQGEINWRRVKEHGIRFAMLRAGYGDGHVDQYFERNARECNRLGIPIGVYWFSYAYSKRTARREADACGRVIEHHRIDYPVAYDFEEASVEYAQSLGVRITKRRATDIVRTFHRRIQRKGYVPMTYTNLDFWENYFYMSRLGKYKIWYAQYAQRPSKTRIDMWQHSDQGRVDGISGDVDLDIAFRRLFRES